MKLVYSLPRNKTASIFTCHRLCNIYLLQTVCVCLLPTYNYLMVLHFRPNEMKSSLLTYSMEQSPAWVALRYSRNSLHFMEPKVLYCIHKCPPPVPILSQIDPVHDLTSHFLKIHLNIILLSMPRSSMWSHSLRFPHQNPVHTSTLPHTCHMLQLTSFFLIWSLEQYWVRSTDH